MSLYQKVRPTTFDGIVGTKNREVAASVRKLAESNDPPRAVMFFGDSGCGKTTLARILATALGVSDNDFREFNSASFRGIDTAREIERTSHFRPIDGERRYWLLDEVHRWTRDSMEAMNKCLEDPPPHAYFALCTTDPDKLLPTIRSRCVQFRVYPLDEADMVRLLHRVAAGEGASFPRAVLQKIAETSQGRPRVALNSLQKMIADPDAGEAALAGVEQTEARVLDLYQAMLRGQGWKAVSAVLGDLKKAGEDAEQVRRYLMACCSNELLRSDSERAALIMDQMVEPFYDSGFPGLVFSCYTVVRSD